MYDPDLSQAFATAMSPPMRQTAGGRVDRLPGGEGDHLGIGDVDQDELRRGIEVELEHTDDRGLAVEIALDHLAEDPAYYTKLRKIHKGTRLVVRSR